MGGTGIDQSGRVLSSSPHFIGSGVPPTSQEFPGKEYKMPYPAPLFEELPTSEGRSRQYRAAGRLGGKKAIITGGDSGIGRATAFLFAREGADVFIAYLPQEEQDAQHTKKRVEEIGRKCHLLHTDLRDRNSCKELAEEAVRVFGGHIDILFNNNAIQTVVEDVIDIPEEQWVNTFDTNIHAFFFLTKYVLPYMGPGSTIINDTSINAYVGRPDLLDYTSTKGAIVSFTRGLSNQQLKKGIRVNAVAPGPVWTPLIPSTMSKELQEQFTSPMGRPIQPSEVAACVVFLASEDSSCVSGQTIHCNGGTIVNG